jgi:hypothetical protein
MDEEVTDSDEFDEFDLETGNQLIVLVWDPDSEMLEIENPHEMPYPLVLGLLHQAIEEWEIDHSEWVFAEDEDD